MDSKNVNFSSILDVIRLYNYNIDVKMMSNIKMWILFNIFDIIYILCSIISYIKKYNSTNIFKKSFEFWKDEKK